MLNKNEASLSPKSYIESIKVFDTIGITYLCTSTVISTLLSLVLPFSILIIFDRVVPNQATSTLMLLFAIILISVWLDNYVKRAEQGFTNRITETFERRVNEKVFGAIANTDMAKFEMIEPSDIVNRVATVGLVKTHNSTDIITGLVNAITCLIVWLTILVINTGAGTIILIASIVLFFLAKKLGQNKLAQLSNKESKESESNAKIVEVISRPINVKSASMEYRLENMMSAIAEDRENYNAKFEQLEADFSLRLQTIGALSVALVVAFCASSVIAGVTGQGAMAAVIMLTNRYFSPYQQVMSAISRRKTNQWHIDRLTELVELEPSLKGERLDQINSICVGDEEKGIRLNRGNVICVLGKSASGKSLLLKALSREYVSDKSPITVNDTEMKDIDYGWWRDNVVRVHSGSAFIDGTIVDNITSFQPSLNKSAFALCESMGIRHYIDGLRQGFYTQIKSSSPLPFPRQVKYGLLAVRAMLTYKQVYLFDDIDQVADALFLDRFATTLTRIKDRTIVVIVASDLDYEHYAFDCLDSKKISL